MFHSCSVVGFICGSGRLRRRIVGLRTCVQFHVHFGLLSLICPCSFCRGPRIGTSGGQGGEDNTCDCGSRSVEVVDSRAWGNRARDQLLNSAQVLGATTPTSRKMAPPPPPTALFGWNSLAKHFIPRFILVSVFLVSFFQERLSCTVSFACLQSNLEGSYLGFVTFRVFLSYN